MCKVRRDFPDPPWDVQSALQPDKCWGSKQANIENKPAGGINLSCLVDPASPVSLQFARIHRMNKMKKILLTALELQLEEMLAAADCGSSISKPADHAD